MSLLLDALKKAALEKQKRDQESQVVGSSSPTIPSVSAEYKRDIFTKKISGSSAVHKTTEELNLEPVHEIRKEQAEELVFNIEETSVFIEEVELPVPEKVIQEKEIVKIDVPAEKEEPTEKEALANLLESSRQTALSSAFTADGSQVPYSEKTVKAAFAQLLGRSHKAAIHQRKRMWLWLVSLSITSFFIVAGYYFFLFTAESSLQDSASFISAESTNVLEESAPQETIAEEVISEKMTTEETVVETTSAPIETTKITVPDSPKKKAYAEKSPTESVAKKETLRVAPEPAQQQTVIYSESGLDKFSQSIETGYAAYQLGNWMQAREAYATALKIEPKHHDALLGAAAVAMRESRYQEALNWYQECLTIDSTNPDYNYNIAITLDHLAQSKEALSFYQKALTLSQQKITSFNPQMVSQRINELERAAQ